MLRLGKRSDAEVTARSTYLGSGRVPLGYMLTHGLESLVNDPLLLMIRYMPGLMGFKLRQIYYKNKLGMMGKGVLFDPDVIIGMPKNVYLDDFCYLGKGTQIYAPEGYIKIGKRCHVGSWILGHGGVEIGDYCAVGGSILSVTDSHQGGARMSGPMVPMEQRNLKYGKITIEDDAFIGQHSMIMPGVTIGEGAIVGPYSMVIRNVKPWTVVMGSPARFVDTREKVKYSRPD